jgi:hypothetical protein
MSSRLNWQQVIILTGMFLLVAGFASPIITTPGEDTAYYWGSRFNPSTKFVLYMLIIASLLMVLRKSEMIWIIGLMMFAMLINDYRIAAKAISETTSEIAWGWSLLFVGSLMLTLTLFLGEDRDRLFSMKLFPTLIPPIDDLEEEAENAEVDEDGSEDLDDEESAEEETIDSPPESML